MRRERDKSSDFHRHEQPLVIEKIAIGGTVRPSAAWRARRRAALPCHSSVRVKKAAWAGRRRLTLTNSEKKMRRPRLSVEVLLLVLFIQCSILEMWRATYIPSRPFVQHRKAGHSLLLPAGKGTLVRC